MNKLRQTGSKDNVVFGVHKLAKDTETISCG